MECRPPSDYLSSAEASKLGKWAESVIARRYLAYRGRTTWYPQGFEDFRDPDAGITNWALCIAFINFHNPWFFASGGTKKLLEHVGFGLVKVPDLMTHSPAESQSPGSTREYYEIKPNSADGLRKGWEKLTNLSALCTSLRLPYLPGVRWTPDEHVTIARLSPFLRFSLHYKLIGPGLVVYEVCTEDPLGEFEAALLAALLAVLLAILLRGLRLPPLRGPLIGPQTA